MPPVLAILLVVSAGCGASDAVDGPFIEDWQLDEQPCEQPIEGSLCYRLTLGVSDHSGENIAECRVYPSDSESVAGPDPAVVLIDDIAIGAGDTPTFDVVLPVIDDEEFLRWLVVCDPGAPG